MGGSHLFLDVSNECLDGISRFFIFPERDHYVFEFQNLSKYPESFVYTDVCGYIVTNGLLLVRSAIGMRYLHLLRTKRVTEKNKENGVLASYFTGPAFTGKIQKIILQRSVEKFVEAQLISGKIYVTEENDSPKEFEMRPFDFEEVHSS